MLAFDTTVMRRTFDAAFERAQARDFWSTPPS